MFYYSVYAVRAISVFILKYKTMYLRTFTIAYVTVFFTLQEMFQKFLFALQVKFECFDVSSWTPEVGFDNKQSCN